MKWLKQLFVEEVHEDSGPSEIAVRVAEIQARIAAFRSSYPWREESYKNSKAQPQHVVETEEHPIINKVQEIDALKAKLLGKKK